MTTNGNQLMETTDISQTIAILNFKISVLGEVGRPGQSMRWEGEIAGSGTITLRESTLERIVYDLEFRSPQTSLADTSFVFAEHSGATEVVWTLRSTIPLFLFFSGLLSLALSISFLNFSFYGFRLSPFSFYMKQNHFSYLIYYMSILILYYYKIF